MRNNATGVFASASPVRRNGRRVATWAVLVSLGGLAAACSGNGAARPPGAAGATTPRTTIAATSAPPTTTAPVSGTVAAPAPKPTAPAGPPYPVQQITLPLVDRSRPTVSQGRVLSSARSLTTVVRLPAASGPRPLILFAHGFDVGPDVYATLLGAWAAHGYVVAAPEFPLTDPAVAGAHVDENDINNQPADLRFVADSLTTGGSPVAARIDRGRVAVTGHSDGAETALAASVLPTPAGEPRFRALIAMSVQPLPGSGATPNPPILVTQGDADTINPPAYGIQTWKQAASPKYLLVLHGGGHLPPLQAGSAWLGGIEAVTEAFLDAYVAGDGAPSAVGAAAAATNGLLSLQSG